MGKAKIEALIRKYVRDNHTQHPGAFPDNLGELTAHAKMLGLSYWDHRTANEERSDKRAGVTEEDYQAWCVDELTELKKVALYN